MMHDLKAKVKKELDNIAEKGLTSSNLEATNKLVDIYKDIVEICEKEEGGENGMYEARGGRGGSYRDSYPEYDDYDARGRSRDSRGRYMDNYGHYPMDEKTERYLRRIREGMEDYNEGRNRYRDGDSDQRMVEGIEMTMGAIVNFVESLMDIAETSKEKEIVRRYVDKIKKV